MQRFELFGHDATGNSCDARDVAARPVKAGDQAKLDRVRASESEDDGNGRARGLRYKRHGGATKDSDHDYLAAKEIGRQLRQTFVMLLGAAIFAPDIEALDIASFF